MQVRGRHDEGAIVAEHVAVMVLVAAFIAALFATGVVESVGEHARVASCNLFGGDCEVELVVDDDAPGRGGGAADGPRAGDAPGGGTQVDPNVLPGAPAAVPAAPVTSWVATAGVVGRSPSPAPRG